MKRFTLTLLVRTTHRLSLRLFWAAVLTTTIALSGCSLIPPIIWKTDRSPSEVRSDNSKSAGERFERLIADKDYDGAAVIYNDYRDSYFHRRWMGLYFQSGRAYYEEELELLVTKLQAKYADRFEQALKRLGRVPEPPLPESDWSYCRKVLDDTASLLSDLKSQEALFLDFEVKPKGLEELKARIRDVSSGLKSHSKESFSQFNHFGKESFFEVYPLRFSSRQHIFREYYQTISDSLESATLIQLEQFLDNYPVSQVIVDSSTALDADEIVQHVRDCYIRAFMSSGGKKPSFILSLEAINSAKKHNLISEEIDRSPIVFLTTDPPHGYRELNHDFRLKVSVDWPVPGVEGTIESLFARKIAWPDSYILLVELDNTLVSRKVVSRRQEPSRYISGYMKVPNPRYEIARLNLLQAEQDLAVAKIQAEAQMSASTPQVTNLGDALVLGLVKGMAKGLAAAPAQARRNEAAQVFQQTPPYLDQPVYGDYQYKVSYISVSKTARGKAYVVNLEQGKVWNRPFSVEDSRDFLRVYDVHTRDPSRSVILARSSSESEVDAFAEAPISSNLSYLFRDFKSNMGSARSLSSLKRYGIPSRTITTPRSTARSRATNFSRPAPDPRLLKVVIVRRFNGDFGAGFFVAPKLIVTNLHVVGNEKHVELGTYSGENFSGEVIAVDYGRDLALILPSISGKPVRLCEGKPPSVGQTVEAIGHPRGLDYSVTRGVISALREFTTSEDIGGRKYYFIQTDTAINPGNSGGPLFVGKNVVGINNWKRVADVGDEGLGFALHCAEVTAFLKSHR